MTRTALRTALIWHDEVMDDLVLAKPQTITIGRTGRTTFVVPDIGLPNLPTWPARKYLIAALIIGVPFLLSAAAALVLVIAEMFAPPAIAALRIATGLMVLSGAALAALAATAYASVSAAGARPFPAASESEPLVDARQFPQLPQPERRLRTVRNVSRNK